MAEHVSMADLVAAREAGAVVVDVREPEEYVGGRVPGAVNVPLGTVPASVGRLARLAGDGPLYLVCKSGGRSAQAADFLAEQGVAARTVDGGTQEWESGGRALDRG